MHPALPHSQQLSGGEANLVRLDQRALDRSALVVVDRPHRHRHGCRSARCAVWSTESREPTTDPDLQSEREFRDTTGFEDGKGVTVEAIALVDETFFSREVGGGDAM